jgi:hypothetical protein
MRKNILIKPYGINDKGVALIIALILLLILTMIGISAITTTTFETSISGNERIGMDAFYASEAGIHMGLNRLPNTNPISWAKLGEDSHYWSGSPQDRNSPKPLKPFGSYAKGGFDSTWQFERFQINATGESFGATKETEIQVSYGPFPGGTVYNN